MCGINGFNFKSEELIQEMNCSLNHRGPDGTGSTIEGNLTLGHVRLAIIDLSETGNQPMYYTHGEKRVCIVFNGEIYNYIELKEQLSKIGYSFSTLSDTEVIMAAYLEWGNACVERFNGMWAFALYDMAKNKLLCSRDRLGVKPFYYYYKEGKFIFSSELKSILKHQSLNINSASNINKDSVELFFSLGYIPSPYTIYKDVYKLPAGNSLTFDCNDSLIENIHNYYKIPKKDDDFDKKQLFKDGSFLLDDSTRIRMRSDVPVGAFLSGGIDSTSVVGRMKNFTNLNNLHTFSIGFDEKKYDETEFINIAKEKFKTQHHHYTYSQSDFNSMWDRYATIFDEPFGDYSSFPTYKVSQIARENVIVVLSGDGGDEVFGGYPLYNIGYAIDRLHALPAFIRKGLYKGLGKFKNKRIAKLTELFRLALFPKKDFHSQMFSDTRYKPSIYKSLVESNLAKCLELSDGKLADGLRLYDLMYNTLADNYLTKVDRCSMANSIEVRSPYLDYRFANFSQKIPTKFKVDGINTKILLQEIIKDDVPKEIIQRKKMGFTPPIYKWLYDYHSKENFIRYANYLKPFGAELENFYNDLFNEKDEVKSYMYNMYMMRLAIFGNWYETWVTK